MTLDDALAACPIVAILRGVRPDEVCDHGEALFAAGVRCVEVPLNSPAPLDSIARLADRFGDRMAIGAGTVLTPVQADEVAAAGGRLIVAPNTDPAVIARGLDLDLAVAPGFATPTEAFLAYAAGARRLKLFPASSFGPAYLKQLTAVLPADATVWAVGGVAPGSMSAWRAAGARAFGLGGDLYRPGQPPDITGCKAELAVEAARAD